MQMDITSSSAAEIRKKIKQLSKISSTQDLHPQELSSTIDSTWPPKDPLNNSQNQLKKTSNTSISSSTTQDYFSIKEKSAH